MNLQYHTGACCWLLVFLANENVDDEPNRYACNLFTIILFFWLYVIDQIEGPSIMHIYAICNMQLWWQWTYLQLWKPKP